MRKAVRAIITRDNSLLVMKRNNFGKRYYTLPGGGVEVGETLEEALVREMAEETGLKIDKLRPVFTERQPAPYGLQTIYLCEDPGGELQMHPDADERSSNIEGKNTYEPTWLAIDGLEGQELLSPSLKQAILDSIKSGFPPEVTQLA